MFTCPTQFEGLFPEFFEKHILPNLPSREVVDRFDSYLRDYLDGEDPLFLVRQLRGLTRGEVVLTDHNNRVMPCDNSPVWQIHVTLLSGAELKEDAEGFFSSLPVHFFQMRGRANLNRAGFHAAHLVDVKDRNLLWRTWTKDELSRRMLLNLHPCNMTLLAKSDWHLHGGRRDILKWVQGRYLDLYGDCMCRFLKSVSYDADCCQFDGAMPYSFCSGVARFSSRLQSASVASVADRPSHVRAVMRPMISKSLIGTDTLLDIEVMGHRYSVLHDDLLAWVSVNTNAMNTESWRRGVYSWPKPNKEMLQFLSRFTKSDEE